MSIPHSFAERGLVFAGAYASMQVGRTLFMLWAVRATPRRVSRNVPAHPRLARVVRRAAGSSAASRIRPSVSAWWALALAIELLGPWALFWVPGLGKSSVTDWNVDGGHMAERCALFVIIALGESLLVTGATFAELTWDAPTLTAFFSAVLGSILMWWIYFDTGAERAQHRIVHAGDPGRTARSAYTYVHIVIVAGIIVCAVADEIVLMHPAHGSDAGSSAILGGPACYLLGAAWFKWLTNDRRTPPLSHMVGLVLLAMLAWPALTHMITPLVCGMATTLVFAVVAGWETISLSQKCGRPLPESMIRSPTLRPTVDRSGAQLAVFVTKAEHGGIVREQRQVEEAIRIEPVAQRVCDRQRRAQRVRRRRRVATCCAWLHAHGSNETLNRSSSPRKYPARRRRARPRLGEERAQPLLGATEVHGANHSV